MLLPSILERSAKLVLIACLPVREMTNPIKHCRTPKFDPQNPCQKLSTVAYACNPSIEEADTGTSLGLAG